MSKEMVGSKINQFSSTRYLGPRLSFMFRTLLVAEGEVYGEPYSYAEFADETAEPPGVIPARFVRMASIAFDLAAHKIMKEGEGKQ